MISPFRAAFLAAPLLLAAPAFAQDEPIADAPDVGGNSFTIGGGAAITPDYEGSDNYRITPAGAIRGSIDGINFQTEGLKLFIDVVPDRPGPGLDIQLGPVVSLNLNRTGHIDDARVDALPERDLAFEVGGYIGIGQTGVITSDYDKLTLSVALVHDVTSTHDSIILTPSLSYGTPLSTKAFVGLTVSGDYVGDGYGATYFSVSPAESLVSGLPVFTADKGWKSVSASLLGNYALTGDLTGGLSLVLAGSYKRMTGDYADSPLTSIAGDRDQWFGALGLAYTF